MWKFHFVIILFFMLGCNSYPWKVFQWNMFSRTLDEKTEYHPRPKSWPADKITLTWLGQATVLVNFYGTTILTDPVLVKRLAPPYLGGHVNLGIKRITPLPLKFEDLPPIDVVLLSHAHYDHWDIASLKYFKDCPAAVIPLGNSDLVPKGSFQEVIELPWGGSKTIAGVTITAFPIEHWGYRHGSPKRNRGYNGYVLSGHGAKIAFFADTAFHSRDVLQRKIHWTQRLGPGPFDLCILPIGDYYFSYNHISPEQAWSIFQQINGRKFLPIHWRTFILSPVPAMEPIERLKQVAAGEADKIVADTPGQVITQP